MTASKVVQISKEIEDARCKGNWKLIPELARRYKKHNPKGESKDFLPLLTASILYNLYLCFWVSLFLLLCSFSTDDFSGSITITVVH